MSGTNTVLGGGSDTVFGGTAGADTVQGSADADSIVGGLSGDLLFGNGGNDTINGGTGDDTIVGGTGTDSIVGGIGADSIVAGSGDNVNGEAGNDTILGAGDGMTLAGGVGSDSISSVGNNNVITGATNLGNDQGSEGDIIRFNGNNNTIFGANGADTIYFDGGSGNSIAGGNQVDALLVTSGFTLTGSSGSGGNAYSIIATPDGSSTISGFESVTVCFAEGSDILTAHGEVRVEKLQAGDLVATVSGRGAPMKPVLWVGRRKVKLAGNPAAHLLTPIRIQAGALGECTPHRDLLVSPDHCMYLDGALVPARLLVNGTTITVERGLSEVTYYHIELENHDVLLAQGAAAESWIDTNNRAWFENAPVSMMQVAGSLDSYGVADPASLCAPLVQGGEKLAAIRDAIAVRALVDVVPATPARDAAAA